MNDPAVTLTEEDLRVLSQELSDTQDDWENYLNASTVMDPCPECTGAGQVIGGTLGDVCVRCNGKRVVERPGQDEEEVPDFRQLRGSITAYGTAVAWTTLPAEAKQRLLSQGQKQPEIPAISTLPTLEHVKGLRLSAKTKLKALAGAPAPASQLNLPAPKKAKGMTGDGHLGEYDDAELDELVDSAEGRR